MLQTVLGPQVLLGPGSASLTLLEWILPDIPFTTAGEFLIGWGGAGMLLIGEVWSLAPKGVGFPRIGRESYYTHCH